jgi:DNA-directed RNA polymerase specialized sigma subunit
VLSDGPEVLATENLSEKQKVHRLSSILEYASQCAFAVRLAVEDVDEEMSLSAERQDNPEKTMLGRDLHSLFKALVAELPSKERKVIEDYYFCEKSFKEITLENPELSKSWVSRLHSRALHQLRVRYLEVSGASNE